MNIVIYHYETDNNLEENSPYDVEKFVNVHSVDISMGVIKSLSFIDSNGYPFHVEFKHPVYIRLTNEVPEVPVTVKRIKGDNTEIEDESKSPWAVNPWEDKFLSSLE